MLNESLIETVSLLKKYLHLLNLAEGIVHHAKINKDYYVIISDNDIKLDFEIPCELSEIEDIELLQVNSKIPESDIINPKEELNFNIPKIL